MISILLPELLFLNFINHIGLGYVGGYIQHNHKSFIYEGHKVICFEENMYIFSMGVFSWGIPAIYLHIKNHPFWYLSIRAHLGSLWVDIDNRLKSAELELGLV